MPECVCGHGVSDHADKIGRCHYEIGTEWARECDCVGYLQWTNPVRA